MAEEVDQGTLWEDETMRRRRTEVLSFSYHGPAVDDGEIDLHAYGEALTGYAEMVRSAVDILDPNATLLDTKICATRQGSFITEVVLSVDMSWFQVLLDYLKGEDAQAIERGVNIATPILGIGGATVGAAIAKALKLVKRQHAKGVADVKHTDDGTVEITHADGEVETVPTQIYNITINNTFRSGATAFISPTGIDGIDSVRFCSGSATTELDKADRHAFQSLEDGPPERQYIEQLEVSVVRLAYDEGKWRFATVPDNDHEIPREFNAVMEDDLFVEQVATGRRTVTAEGILLVEMETTIPAKEGKKRVVPRYRILKVLEVRPHIAPPSLLDENGDLN